MSTISNSKPASTLSALLQLSPVLARLAALGFAAGLSLLLLYVFQPGFTAMEEKLGALGWTLAPDGSVEERITLVVIDERSIAQVGPWPWSREDMARLVTAIDNLGAQLQLHDITYPEARPGDEQFLAAIDASSGVLMAQTPALPPVVAAASSTGLLTHPVAGVVCDTPNAGIQIPAAGGFVASAPVFASVPKGHITPIIDRGGAVRRSPALICHQGTAYPALAIAAFLELGRFGSNAPWRGEIEAGSSLFDPPATLHLHGYPGLHIPLDEDAAMRVSYARAPDSFVALSAIDVMNGRVDPGRLENIWTLVGVTAFGTGDIVPTPYSGAAFGVEIQARLLASLLDLEVPFTPSGAAFFLLLLAALFAGISYGLATIGDRVAAYGLPVAAILLPVMALALHMLLLGSSNLWLGWVGPALYGATAAGCLLLLELARTRLERNRVFSNLHSYLPADVAREIAFSLPTSRVNAQRRDVTLLNADLRNFSAFGEARPPEEIAAVLHYFFTRATAIIESHGGRVQEFKGDSVLAIWDAADSMAARQALRSARAMHQALNDKLLPEQSLASLEPLALGIGIEQGPVLIGSIGPPHRRSHTLLGDTVGITLRIQEMTAELAQPVLIGECAARQLSDENLESQGSYLLSGLRIPHTLFASAVPAAALSHDAQPRLTVVSGGRR